MIHDRAVLHPDGPALLAAHPEADLLPPFLGPPADLGLVLAFPQLRPEQREGGAAVLVPRALALTPDRDIGRDVP